MKERVAFLRGINIGGNVKLSMSQLVEMCSRAGFKNVHTYINSGNAIFESDKTQSQNIQMLESELLKTMSRQIDVVIRDAQELKELVENNPFKKADPAKVGVVLLNKSLPKDYLKDFNHSGPEEIQISDREIYVHYSEGMGRSKLKLPKIEEKGTVRNINTLSKIAGMLKT